MLYIVRCSECNNESVAEIIDDDRSCPVCSAGADSVAIVSTVQDAMPPSDVMSEGMRFKL